MKTISVAQALHTSRKMELSFSVNHPGLALLLPLLLLALIA